MVTADPSRNTRLTSDDFLRSQFNWTAYRLCDLIWYIGMLLGLVEPEETFAPATAVFKISRAVDWLIWGWRPGTNP